MSGIDYDAIARALKRRGLCHQSPSQLNKALTPVAPPGSAPAHALVPPELAKYRDDPVGFFVNILGVTPTDTITTVLRQLPGRVKMETGHGLGKSHAMAGVALWWHYTRNPSIVVCSAPSSRAVDDVLWTEIRLMLQRVVYPLDIKGLAPKASTLYDTPDHWIKGYTTSKGESFQGRHRENMLFVFDEDEGIEAIFWENTNTMYQPDAGHCWVAGCNPLTTSSRSYIESTAKDYQGNPKWKTFSLSSLDHPNVAAGLKGEKPPIPGAVTLGQVEQWISDWTSEIDPGDKQDGDVEWPPGSGKYRRPGPMFKARALGIRPIEGIDNAWSVLAWMKANSTRRSAQECWDYDLGITIGLDAAGYGDDDTVFHVRTGPISLHHEPHNGWSPKKSADRLKTLCVKWAEWYNSLATYDRPKYKATDVKVIMEFDGGYGVGVHSHRDEFENWHGITVGGKSDKIDPMGKVMYADVRSEIWLESSQLALKGSIDVSRLEPDARERLRSQLTTPYYEIQRDGSRRVESKKEVKERLGRSPDDADAFILSHYRPLDWGITAVTRGDN